MKHYEKTLLQLQYKLDLSQVGTCATCHAVSFHGTKEFARQRVAEHRALSHEVRMAVGVLLNQIELYDAWVEEAHQKVVHMRLEEH